MTVYSFTSFTLSYLNRARVLAKTLKTQHPDWPIWAIVVDCAPLDMAVNWEAEPFDKVLFLPDLIEQNPEAWIFGHTIVEACTAIKGVAARRILSEPNCDKLIYLDPDIAVFNDLDDVSRLLDNASIVLTPHQVKQVSSADNRAIVDNEITSLSHGAYNLGFLAISGCDEGRAFCEWWDDRLRYWCVDQKDTGLFVDQKWCDLAPCLFANVSILRDPGYNVASWNLRNRELRFGADGIAYVNGRPLRFFHFTKLGPVGDVMTRRYAGRNHEIHELWAWYRNEVAANSALSFEPNYWHYGSFDNGVAVTEPIRRLYRDRQDLKNAFPNPFSVAEGFYDWLKTETELLHQLAA